ncbi:MAG TPA: SLC13 family permease [Nitrospirota bacterium]|nr:SLC13 family permease [Nitrospirota bacterium]
MPVHVKVALVITALIIFIITYIFIGLRQIPRIRIDRPAGALVGAVLMVVAGVLTLDQAFAAIDMHTLLLLLGMMIITVYLRTAGFFELMADKILSLSRTPFQLLIFVVLSSGLLSALFVNDTICLLYTPIILEVTAQLGVNPMPYLLALATSSNIGSVMTVTGNPQNMLIGIYSKIPYLSFLGSLFPVALAGFVVCIAVIWFLYRKEMGTKAFPSRPVIPRYQVRKALLVKSLLVCAGVLVSFSLGHPYSLTAAAGAVALLLIGRVRTERILEGVDWTLLAFFAGLFVVMHGVEESGLAGAAIKWIGDLSILSPAGQIAGLSLVSAFLSNVVSNVPAVMLLKPLTLSLGGGKFIWLALAMSSTLAGNLTLIGSVANLIVAQQAKRKVDIGFMEYFRVGALITAITVAVGILVLVVEVKIGNGAELPVVTGQASRKNVIVTSAGKKALERTFRVALFCDTDDLRTKGLQGFRRLAADEAALFVFEDLVEVTFWMGSVDFPIDIIFVGQDRKVVQVYQNCRPGSLDLYPSGKPVLWVIETAAGSGIRVGDRVRIQGQGSGVKGHGQE